MARYRKLEARVWADAKFRGLSPQQPSGQTLWLYLLLGPQTESVPGLFSAGEAALAEALGWGLEDFRRCWSEIERQGMAKADWAARVVWVPNALRYNEPASPNVVRSWPVVLEAIPECALKAEACAALAAQLAAKGDPAWSKAAREAFGEAFGEALPESRTRTIPPNPPSGGGGGDAREEKKQEKRPILAPCDRPELVQAAERVIAHYLRVVRPSWIGKAPARPLVMTLLDEGRSEEQLCHAADGYAAACNKAEREPKARQAAKTFFSPDGEYADFLDYQPPPPTPRPQALPLPKFTPSPEALEMLRNRKRIDPIPNGYVDPKTAGV